jgi:hypothetical protein
MRAGEEAEETKPSSVFRTRNRGSKGASEGRARKGTDILYNSLASPSLTFPFVTVSGNAFGGLFSLFLFTGWSALRGLSRLPPFPSRR